MESEQNLYLNMTKGGYLDVMNTSAATFDTLFVGAAVVRKIEADSTPDILLLRRRQDAAYYPGIFEIPNSEVEDSEANIEEALMKLVLDDCHLRVAKVLYTLPETTYLLEQRVTGTDGVERVVKKKAIQLNYVVQVHEGDVLEWNANVHCDGWWVEKSMLNVSSHNPSLIPFYSLSRELLPSIYTTSFSWGSRAKIIIY